MSKVDSRNPARLDSDETAFIAKSTTNRTVYHTERRCKNVQNMHDPHTKTWEVVKRMNLSWCERCQRLVGQEQ